MKPIILVSHAESMPSDFLADFVEEVERGGIDVRTQSHGNIFAGIEWLMPTAIVVYFAKPYFDAILSEIGKDHYKALKRSLGSLYRRASRLRVSLVGSKGKISVDPKYSLCFSLEVSVSANLRVKLLMQPDLAERDAEIAINAFLDVVGSIVSGKLTAETAVPVETEPGIGRRTVLLAFDFESGRISAVDPLSDVISEKRNDN